MKKDQVAYAQPVDDGIFHPNFHKNIIEKFNFGNITEPVLGLVGIYFIAHFINIVLTKISSIGVGL